RGADSKSSRQPAGPKLDSATIDRYLWPARRSPTAMGRTRKRVAHLTPLRLREQSLTRWYLVPSTKYDVLHHPAFSGAHPMIARRLLVVLAMLAFTAAVSAQEKLNTPPPGFKALFNGKDLTGWKGLPLKANMNPKKKEAQPYVAMTMPDRLNASPGEFAEAQQRGDQSAREHWKVEDGVLVFDGKGQNLCTDKDYGDFELYVDWKIHEKADSGIYLRGSPQIQIWDPYTSPKIAMGEDKGSGGIYNNQKNSKEPIALGDKPIGQWNTFWI